MGYVNEGVTYKCQSIRLGCFANEPLQGLSRSAYKFKVLCTIACAFLGASIFDALAQTTPFDYGFESEDTASAPISFNASASGILDNPMGPSGLVSSGSGTGLFTWGSGVASPPSLLAFSGKSVTSVQPGQPFVLGSLSYFNGVILASSEANSVNLRTALDYSGQTTNFDFEFRLINTLNTADPIASADSVFISALLSSTGLSIDGTDYTLNLEFGSVTGSGVSEIDQFFVFEGGSASADLIGTLTAVSPPVVPEPSTIVGGFSAVGLVLAAITRRLRRGGVPRELA